MLRTTLGALIDIYDYRKSLDTRTFAKKLKKENNAIWNKCVYMFYFLCSVHVKTSEYDQEIPQSQTANNRMATP